VSRIRLHLAAALNEAPRQVLSAGFMAAGRVVPLLIRRRIVRHGREQERLRPLYGITPDTPIRPWGPEQERSVEAFAAGRQDVRFAYTSGSTSRPKKIAFTPTRLRTIKRGSLEAAVQAGRAHRIQRPTLFILAAMQEDDSLSTLLLAERKATSYGEGLVMPSRYLWEPALQDLLARYGAAAVRLWLLVLSNPGIIYSTNPSTLAVFLDTLEGDWPASSALVRAFRDRPASLGASEARVARRVVAPGWSARARVVADAAQAPSMGSYLPGLRAYCCWDGGYVTPFLRRIARSLPPERFGLMPMYSMSTETVETLAWYHRSALHFLPIAPGVLYEFLPEGADDEPDALLGPRDLEVGQAYSMVVSDPYGLRRYQTNDLFACVGRVLDVPDLRFLRRRGLAYSFTGEKLTGEQVQAAFVSLQDREPGLLTAGVQLTCIPSLGVDEEDGASPGSDVPHYRLVMAHAGSRPPPVDESRAAAQFDRSLGEQNREFAAKLASGRLGPTQAVHFSYDTLARLMQGGDDGARGWETQFKLVPLYTKRWEELGLPAELVRDAS